MNMEARGLAPLAFLLLLDPGVDERAGYSV
jgi:hypothetical protein